MKTIVATEQGEYVHCIYKLISTEQDGDAYVLFAIDNASKHCYPAHFAMELDEVSVSKHLFNVIKEVTNTDQMMHPTFILGYGADMMDALTENFSDHATIIFAQQEAERIAIPAVHEITGGRI